MSEMVDPRAVVVDHWPLFREGIIAVLGSLDVEVVGQSSQARAGVQLARENSASLVILGQHDDPSIAEGTRLAKKLPSNPKVLGLLSWADKDELARLLSNGIDGILMRTAGVSEVSDSLTAIIKGERVIAPALMPTVTTHSGALLSDGHVASNPLTLKEREVLVSLGEGHSNREIAETLFITPATVKTHLAHIYAKLGATDRHEALARAVALGLLG